MGNAEQELKFDSGWWFPSTETHMMKVMKHKAITVDNRLSYQFYKFLLSVTLMPKTRHRVALDIGSNVGTWSYNMSNAFEKVHCFEPLEIHRRCWAKNTEGLENLELHPFALGEKHEFVAMHMPLRCTGGAYIGDILSTDNVETIDNIEVKTLDDYGFEDVDFIKFDIQGYELKAIQGGMKTILRNRPFILIEQKGEDREASEFLESYGMFKMFEMIGDIFMSWCPPTEEYQAKINNFVETVINKQ